MTRIFLVVAAAVSISTGVSFAGAFHPPGLFPASSPRGSSPTSGYLAVRRVVAAATSSTVPLSFGQHVYAWNRCSTATYTGRGGGLPAALSENEEDGIENPEEFDSSEATTPAAGATPPLSSSPNNTPAPASTSASRPLDPLFVAVTRMDETTASAPTVSVPIWGDLILDRSLFVFLPLLGFGLGGIVLSLYIVFNSGDALVDAMADNAVWQSSGGGGESITTTVDSPAACRGLCSSQEQDLQGLREYMSRFAKSTPGVSME